MLYTVVAGLLYSNINFNKTNETESKNVVTYSMLS